MSASERLLAPSQRRIGPVGTALRALVGLGLVYLAGGDRVRKTDPDVHSVASARSNPSTVAGVAATASLDEAPQWARELLESEPLGHLGLLDDEGRPRVLPVTFALVGNEIWSAVDEKPKRVGGSELARVRWLRARPSSALTVDRYSSDWSRLAWVQLIGTTTIVDVAGQEPVLEALSARYAPYRERPPRGPLLRLLPDRCAWWRSQP